MPCIRCGDQSAIYKCQTCESIERERQEDAEREERAHEEHLEQLRENAYRAERAAYERMNPGQYDCPACLYRTLKRRATRCPTCQASIPSEYWSQVDAKEKAEKEEWERGAPASATRAAEEVKRARLAAELQERENAKQRAGDLGHAACYTFFTVYYGYLLPVVCVFTGVILAGGFKTLFLLLRTSQAWLLLVPALNWLVALVLLVFGSDGSVTLKKLGYSALAGLPIGLVIGIATRQFYIQLKSK